MKLQEVAYLRCFAVLTLVAWHSYCSYICWGVATSPANAWYTLLFRFITPDANMPLFTFLSGYLFAYLFIEKGKYQDFKAFLFNKIHRLLIPFLVLGSVINLCEYGKSISDMIYGKPNHLWYCLMLFYCFLICWLVEKKIGRKFNIAIGIVSLFVVLYQGNGILAYNSPLGLILPIYYYCYFLMGFLVYLHRFIVLKFVRKYWLPILIAYIVFSYKSGHFLVLSAILYILLLFSISKKTKLPPPIAFEFDD